MEALVTKQVHISLQMYRTICLLFYSSFETQSIQHPEVRGS